MYVIERFAQYVRPSASGCLEWTGATNRGGYGRFYRVRGSVFAHRAILDFCEAKRARDQRRVAA